MIVINTSTGQRFSHDGATSILVNGRIVNRLMRCVPDHGSDPRNSNVTYLCTALRAGSIALTAHTTYYGAEWYSTELHFTVVETCTGMQQQLYQASCGKLDAKLTFVRGNTRWPMNNLPLNESLS